MTKNVAHIRERDGEEQSLEEHLRGTAILTDLFTSEIGLEKTGELIGLLHDFGKASERFAAYIRSEAGIYKKGMLEYKKYYRGDIDHSTAGAQYLDKNYNKDNRENTDLLSLQMIELSVLSHHSGLINCLEGGEDKFKKRISKSVDETAVEEAKLRIEENLTENINSCADLGIRSLSNLLSSIQTDLKQYLRQDDPDARSKIKSKLSFRIGLLERYLLSCLIDADRIDSSSFETPNKETVNNVNRLAWVTLLDRCEKHLSTFDLSIPINNIRKNISDQCYRAASRPRGTYLLSVPTGGGKTLSSLLFALKHAKEHNLKRIFYVIPYTTIIDQNAKVIRKVLERDHPSEKIVLEHHSNLDPSNDDISEDSQYGGWRLASENWDAQIILTTFVQFMDCLFSSGTKSVRRMHNLANSVIIFDEVQTLPTKTVYLFNEAVNFISGYCGSTIVLCTATQPLLDSNMLDHPIYLSENPEIAAGAEPDSLYKELRRTDIIVENSGNIVDFDYVSSLAVTKIKEYNSVLIIVNTKGFARQICDLIGQKIPETIGLFHLSTNMCSANRIEVLESLKNDLDKGKKTICVSTQLIEAGVDIDFNVVIRSIAGIDSIAQAAGRCNREGRMANEGKIGKVYLVNLNEKIENLTNIYFGKDNAKEILHGYSDDLNDIITPEALKKYYKHFFYDIKGEMSYLCKDRSGSLFSLLSTNEEALKSYYHKNNSLPKTIMHQSFMAANKEFKVIDDGTIAIIVSYNRDAEKIISDLCSEHPSEHPKLLLRRAQKYSINVFKRTFDDLLGSKAIREISNSDGPSGIYYLVDGNYDEKYGLKEGSELRFLKK